MSASASLEGHLATLLDPSSFAAEQYRVLRHQIEQLQRSQGLAVVAVSSPAVGEGKTTTAINLAGTLAQAPGARVLLVDADLRRPAVGGRLGLGGAGGGPGLAGAMLEPAYELTVVVRHRSPFNLSVLPAGRCPETPDELLGSARLGELMAEAREAYDFVVIDTPPLLLVPDCRSLGKWADGFLIVVSAHKTPRKLLEEALRIMEPEKVIGIVFNHDDRPLSGYYKQYSGYYTRFNRAGSRGLSLAPARGEGRPSGEGER